MTNGRRVGNWMKFNLGDRVYDQNDPRHEGTVEAIRWGHEAKVKWDSGLFSDVPLHELKKVAEDWAQKFRALNIGIR